MRIGTQKESRTDRAIKDVRQRTVPSKTVGSPAFDLDDPIQKLLFTIGAGFFNENSFYDTEAKEDHRGHKPSGGMRRGKGKTVQTKNKRDELDLTAKGSELLATMRAVAESENPEDLLVIARWARDDLRLRQTPVMALCVAARVESELKRQSGDIRKYTKHILKRADEPRRAFAAYRHLYLPKVGGGRRDKSTFPHGLARGMIEALQGFNEYQLLKYDSGYESPSMSELFRFLMRYEGRKGKGRKRTSMANMRPGAEAIIRYFVTGEIDEEKLPKLAARKKLATMAGQPFVGEVKELAKVADVGWEWLKSHFKGPEVWRHWLSEKPPYMALLRNLRNLEEAGLSDGEWDRIYDLLVADVDHKQLPFRFLAARREVGHQTAISAIDVALDRSVKYLPDLPGKTFIMVDSSGSMDSGVSEKSKMSNLDAGYTLAALLAKRIGRRAVVGVFGQSFAQVKFSEADSVMRIIGEMRSKGEKVGHATNAWLALAWLMGHDTRVEVNIHHGYGYSGYGTKTRDISGQVFLTPRPDKPMKVDRIVIISDMHCYTNHQGGSNVPELLARYRKEINEDVFYYSINLDATQSKMDPDGKRNLLLSGYSEKTFGLFKGFEEGAAVDEVSAGTDDRPVEEKQKQIPTIVELRERFLVR